MLAARAQHRHAAVASDRVEPCLERDPALALPLEVPEGGGKGVLNDVLGLLTRAEHVAAESQDPRAVTLERHLEGELVAAPDLLDEAVVARKGEQPLRAKQPDRGPSGEGSGFHGLGVVPIGHMNAIGAQRFARNPRTFALDRRFTPHEEDYAGYWTRPRARTTRHGRCYAEP
jgi:hypothetical protein